MSYISTAEWWIVLLRSVSGWIEGGTVEPQDGGLIWFLGFDMLLNYRGSIEHDSQWLLEIHQGQQQWEWQMPFRDSTHFWTFDTSSHTKEHARWNLDHPAQEMKAQTVLKLIGTRKKDPNMDLPDFKTCGINQGSEHGSPQATSGLTIYLGKDIFTAAQLWLFAYILTALLRNSITRKTKLHIPPFIGSLWMTTLRKLHSIPHIFVPISPQWNLEKAFKKYVHSTVSAPTPKQVHFVVSEQDRIRFNTEFMKSNPWCMYLNSTY